jgi:hypothetical protein
MISASLSGISGMASDFAGPSEHRIARSGNRECGGNESKLRFRFHLVAKLHDRKAMGLEESSTDPPSCPPASGQAKILKNSACIPRFPE